MARRSILSKKQKPVRRRPAARAGRAPKTVQDYVAGIPGPSRGTFKTLRAAIRSAVPRDATETISYRIPAFRHNGILVWFAAFSGHCSLFPTAAVIAAFEDELKDYTVSKGTIQFPNGKALPVALIRKLVKARVAQSEGKKRQ